MNEVTRIHLGRQPFTISVEAHLQLKKYLAEIEKKVGDADVINEVETRMSELLLERGVSDEKVVLPADVEYLKQQLGSPADFGDDEADEPAPKSDGKVNRRLFRDTDNAIVAGVAAGLANFFGLDPVVVRLLFVALAIFSGGLGIFLYLFLWLVTPPAASASDKLQMRGKAVTLEALKNTVSSADMAGAAGRVSGTVTPVINGIFRAFVKIIGAGFVLAGIGLLLTIFVLRVYMQLHHGQLFQEGIFPIGLREQWLVWLVMLLGAITAAFSVLIGIDAFKRKWPIRGWITGLLIGLFLFGAAASAALAADAFPRVRERYEATLHTTAIKNIQPFNQVSTNGNIDIAYVSSPNYAVNLHYSGNPDISKVKVYVKDNTLYVNSEALDQTNHCTMLCIFPSYNMSVQVYAPNVQNIRTPPHTEIFYPAPPSLN